MTIITSHYQRSPDELATFTVTWTRIRNNEHRILLGMRDERFLRALQFWDIPGDYGVMYYSFRVN